MSNLLNHVKDFECYNFFSGTETQSNHKHCSFLNKGYHIGGLSFLNNFCFEQNQKENQYLYQTKFGNQHFFSREDKPDEIQVSDIYKNQQYSELASLAESDCGSIELSKKNIANISEIEVNFNYPKQQQNQNPQKVKKRKKISKKSSKFLPQKQPCIIFDEKNNPSTLIKNETKNIPKNYGKAIISFIEKNREKVNRILQFLEIDYEDLINEFKLRKRTINTISDLRNLWINNRFSKPMRILSNLFLRKYSLIYIFNSRITNFTSHIKYRHKLREALIIPANFRNIKDF